MSLTIHGDKQFPREGKCPCAFKQTLPLVVYFVAWRNCAIPANPSFSLFQSISSMQAQFFTSPTTELDNGRHRNRDVEEGMISNGMN